MNHPTTAFLNDSPGYTPDDAHAAIENICKNHSASTAHVHSTSSAYRGSGASNGNMTERTHRRSNALIVGLVVAMLLVLFLATKDRPQTRAFLVHLRQTVNGGDRKARGRPDDRRYDPLFQPLSP